MLAALLRYPRRERRAVAQSWARRSHATQAAARIARGPDADTLHRRALHDARGQVVRAGVIIALIYRQHGLLYQVSWSGRCVDDHCEVELTSERPFFSSINGEKEGA